MATEAERLASIRTNLLATLDNVTARAAELDAVPLDQRARMTYTDGGQTYDWNGLRASLAQRERDAMDRLESLTKISGPFTLTSLVR